MRLELVLPWPPSVNHYKKVGAIVRTKSGKLYQRRVNTNETNTYYYQVYILTKNKIPDEWGKFAVSRTITYSVDVLLYPPNNRRYDIDNRAKVLLDSLVRAHIIADDAQITMLRFQKMDIIDQGQVIVKLMTLSGEDKYA